MLRPTQKPQKPSIKEKTDHQLSQLQPLSLKQLEDVAAAKWGSWGSL